MVLTKGQEVWEELYNEREIINDEKELKELMIKQLTNEYKQFIIKS